MSLENGRYIKYVEGLISGFKADQVSSSDLPDLDQGDLKLFGIDLFKDRKHLKQHFVKLRANINQFNEGNTTQYL